MYTCLIINIFVFHQSVHHYSIWFNKVVEELELEEERE